MARPLYLMTMSMDFLIIDRMIILKTSAAFYFPIVKSTKYVNYFKLEVGDWKQMNMYCYKNSIISP